MRESRSQVRGRSGRTTAWTAALGLFALVATARAAADQDGGGALSCSDQTVVASAVRTEAHVQAFVRCAYEFVQEAGFTEARRAFQEDARWRSGPIYVFVDESTSAPGASRALVFPPDPSREGTPWGTLVDGFGSDLVLEFHRVATGFGEGWVYYTFTNPVSGRAEPKAAYVRAIDWDGTPAVIGAGIYRRDIPATCEADQVNAGLLESDPSDARLREFVRCAAMELEASGYYAVRALSSHPRWRARSIYLFGLDTRGNPLFNGNPNGQSRWGILTPELTGGRDGPFGGRDVVRVGDAFGETFLYYAARNPSTGAVEGKVAFVKRVVISGQPILIGAGYFPGQEGGEPGESGTQYGLSDTAREVRSGVVLTLDFDSARRVFAGTVTNTTNATVRQVRVEVHLSNGVELGPTPNVDLTPGQTRPVELDAQSQTFTRFSAHVEIGASEHGGGEGGDEGSGGGGEHGGGRGGGEHGGGEGGGG